PRVLEEAPNDALDANVLGEPRDAGPEAADAADDQLDRHASATGAVEAVDDLRIDQRVQLGPDAGRPAGLGTLGLHRDQPQEVVLHADRRVGEFLHLARQRIA